MSQPVHTPGPLRVDGQNIIAGEAQIGVAKVYGNIGQPREANARLLAAAYNAFDSAARKLGCNAVELAERMQDGNLLTELLTALCLDDLIPDLSAYKPVIEFVRRTSTDLGAKP